MSSPAGLQPHFLSRWMPSSSRAGVILDGSPVEVGSVRSSCASPGLEASVDDSFCSHFAPLPVSRSSSCVSVDSDVPKETSTDAETEPSHLEMDSFSNILGNAQEFPLIEKLEQLKQLQQRMQAELKSHQLNQLHKLQNDQQTLMGMVQTAAGEHGHGNRPCCKPEVLRPLQETPLLFHAQHADQLPDEVEKKLESSVWSLEQSDAQTSSRQDDDNDEDPSEKSHQSITEDQSFNAKGPVAQDRPITSGDSGKTFEEILEEQLKLENERLSKSAPAVPVKVKRPFLKRGEGLSRFTRGKAPAPATHTTHSSTKPTPCLDPPPPQGRVVRFHQSSEPKRLPPKSSNSTNVVIQRKTAVMNKENLPQNKISVTAAKGLAKAHVLGANRGCMSKSVVKSDPQQITTCATMVDITKGKPSEQIRDTRAPRMCAAENSFEVWLTERGERWDRDHRRERAELGEFELLEKVADEFSFSSNSSFINNLLCGDHRRLSSTPVKPPLQPTLRGRCHSDAASPVQPRAGKVDGPAAPPVGAVEEMMKPAGVTSECSEDEEDKMWEESNTPSRSSTESQRPVTGPNQPFNHCFQVFAPPYDKHSYQDREGASNSEVEEENEDHTLVGIGGQVEFDDDDTWNEPDDLTCSSSKMDSQPDRALKRKVVGSKEMDSDGPVAHGPEDPPSCQLVAKLFPALKPKPCSRPLVQDAEDINGEGGAGRSRLLRERLVELETEIERFRRENAALIRLRQENQDVRESLRKERVEFQQKMADETAKWEEFKREEGRKLQRDRKLFEKHAAAVRARPDKQERDEIQTLKQQLNAAQDDLRKREARWTSNHSRLRQQLDALSTENAALRDQVRTLEKLRLSAWKTAEGEREKEKERGRSNVHGSTGAPRTKSKSPSCSVTSTLPQSKTRRQSPDIPSASVSSIQQKERCPPATPDQMTEQLIGPERRCQDSQPIKNSTHFSELSSVGVAEQSEMEQEEISHTDGKIEKVLPDGGRLIVFPNGTRKELSADGLSVKVTFFNGDIKHVMPDQRVIYYYAGAQTTHTTYPDGMEVLQFPNNQIEKHFPDGRKEITFPDQTVKTLYPDGREESVLTDGTIIQQNPDGSKEIQFNTGQRELHTADFKRRQYPDGTVKTVYADGRQETCYPGGRVRLKDQQGHVVMDTKA
ncbi:centrosomal P4.1-associated protein isoform X2 [Brachyhypopomus gauderio]|uniref:centrosomal P4.1-associated protein isoform X2 n=1 Tax=Brachyhypopomus gauderio TaxID=698409 RepID=UPI004041A1F8